MKPGGLPPEESHTDARSEPEAERIHVPFTEAGSAAVAALLHLIRLLGSELVLTRGIDITVFEQAVRKRIGEFTSPTASPQAREAGLATARYLLDQVLTQVRGQAEVKRTLAADYARPAQADVSADPSRLLN